MNLRNNNKNLFFEKAKIALFLCVEENDHSAATADPIWRRQRKEISSPSSLIVENSLSQNMNLSNKQKLFLKGKKSHCFYVFKRSCCCWSPKY